MTLAKKSLRTQLGKVRGLCSAKAGTHHLMAQRATALFLVPLAAALLVSFIGSVIHGDYASTVEWLHSGWVGGFALLFLAAGFYHAALGLQVVIEDYVSCTTLKLFSLVATKFVAALFFILGAIAILRIQLMDLPPHV